MIYEYTTTYEDFKAAQRLCMRRTARAKVRSAFYLWVLPVIGTGALVAVACDMAFRHFSFSPSVGGVLFAVAWFGLYPSIYRPFLWKKLYKQMKNGRPDGSPLQFGIEGDQVISRIPGRSEGRFNREAVIDFIEDDQTALLFVAKKRFLMLPKTALPAACLEELRAWLHSGRERLG